MIKTSIVPMEAIIAPLSYVLFPQAKYVQNNLLDQETYRQSHPKSYQASIINHKSEILACLGHLEGKLTSCPWKGGCKVEFHGVTALSWGFPRSVPFRQKTEDSLRLKADRQAVHCLGLFCAAQSSPRQEKEEKAIH